MWKDAEVFLLSDRYVAPLVKKYGHCTLKPRQKKYYFEDLVDAIVQQQLSMKAASAIFNRLKEVIEKQEAKIKTDFDIIVGVTGRILKLTEEGKLKLPKKHSSPKKTPYMEKFLGIENGIYYAVSVIIKRNGHFAVSVNCIVGIFKNFPRGFYDNGYNEPRSDWEFRKQFF